MRHFGCLLFVSLWVNGTAWAVSLKVNGSSTVNPVVVEASEIFQAKGWEIFVDTQGGSSGGISYVAEELAHLGMSSRPISEHDRKKYPAIEFVEHVIGYDGVALVVSTDLYNAGVTSLTRTQIKDIYEGRIKNWKDVGGPDRRVVFYNKEPGRGTWEVFAKFVYGKTKGIPKVFHPEVGANQEARTKVANHKGGVTQLSASWAWNQEKVRALAIIENGKKLSPSMTTIASGEYPMRRPLLVITKGKAVGAQKELIEFLRGPEGQKLVKKHGYLSHLKRKD